MDGITTLSLEQQVAIDILKGASTADIAEINHLQYSTCRQYLHRYCSHVNSAMYEELSIRAAHHEICSPTMDMLRQHKESFLPKEVICSGTIKELEEALQKERAEGHKKQIEWRKARACINQLQQQLDILRSQSQFA